MFPRKNSKIVEIKFRKSLHHVRKTASFSTWKKIYKFAKQTAIVRFYWQKNTAAKDGLRMDQIKDLAPETSS